MSEETPPTIRSAFAERRRIRAEKAAQPPSKLSIIFAGTVVGICVVTALIFAIFN